MRKIKLYIATSIDGFIARPDGELDWLTEFPNPNGLDYDYANLLNSIDTVLMGGKTYSEIMGYGVEWPYKSKATLVVARRDMNRTPNEHVSFITEDVIQAIRTLKEQEGKDIWLVGGGQLVTMLLNHDLIDEMQICTIPVIISQGIPLFPNKPKESTWKLADSQLFNTGVSLRTYRK